MAVNFHHVAPIVTLTATPSTVVGNTLLPATTYHLAITSTNGTSYNGPGFYVGGNASPVRSDVYKFTCTTGATDNTISLSWTEPIKTSPVAFNLYYSIYISTDGGVQYSRLVPNGTSANTITTANQTSFTITGNETTNINATLDTFTAGTFYPMLNQDDGKIQISFVGDTNNITVDDVYNEIVSAGYSKYAYYAGDTLYMMGSIIVEETSTGTLDMTNKRLVLIQGKLYSLGKTLTLNGTDIIFGQWSTSFNSPLINFTNASFRQENTMKSYAGGSLPWAGGGDGPYFAPSGTYTFSGENMWYGAGTVDNTTKISNFTFLSTVRTRNISAIDPPEIKDCKLNTWSSNTGTDVTPMVFERNKTVLASHSLIIRGTGTYTGIMSVVDCDFASFRRSKIAPRIYLFTATAKTGFVCHAKASRVFRVIDKNGTPIESAEIEIRNKDGDLVHTFTTDVNGETSSTQVICYVIGPVGSTGNTYTDENDTIYQGPFAVKIKKSGFLIFDKKVNIETVSEIQELIIDKKRLLVWPDGNWYLQVSNDMIV